MANLGRPKTKEEVLVSHGISMGRAVEPVTQVRSTLIAASILSLRSRGHVDAYLRNLPERFHDDVLHAVAGMWLPLEVGLAHYRAAEALGLGGEEQSELGRGVAERIQNNLLGTLVRVAKGAGVTPWVGLEYLPKLWQRTVMGGGIAIYRLGPKEARVESHGMPELAELSYFRNAYRGMFASSGQLFCSKIYVHDLAHFTAQKVIGFRLAWA